MSNYSKEPFIPYNVIYDLYVIQKKSMNVIAKELGCAVGTVFNYSKKYGIDPREQRCGMKGKHHSDEARSKLSLINKGKVRSLETRHKLSEAKKQGGIGHKKKRDDGYISIYFPDHPQASKDGYIMEHILVMECLVGRHIPADEQVHHINGKRDDNRKENLQLMTSKERASYHMKKRWEEKRRNDLSINQS